MNLLIISLCFGLISCFFVIWGFSYETYQVYKSKSSETLTLGSLALQVVSAACGAVCAGINIYISGIENVPFVITNTGILINLILLIIMKCKFN